MEQRKIFSASLLKRRRPLLWIAAGLAVLAAALALALRGTASAEAADVPTPASFTIISPARGATVGSPVQLAVAVKGSALGSPTAGLDHLHVSIDGGPALALYKNHALSVPLKPGKHVIGVDLAGPTHEPMLPAQYVAFTVR